MRRTLALVYGLGTYAIFLLTFLYAIGFVGNIVVPKSIDSAATAALPGAVLVNAALLALFALQHSVMARPGFKRWWTRIVPPPVERSTYVLFASVALILLFWQWRPMGGVVWDVSEPVARGILYGLCAAGWGLVLAGTFFINHFDLFGLRQAWLYATGRPYTRIRFGTPGPYRSVRHPLYVGFIVAFWATPTMTMAHLFFAVMTAAYILVAIRLEERDLVKEHGADYAAYRRRVPMLVPRWKRGPANAGRGAGMPAAAGIGRRAGAGIAPEAGTGVTVAAGTNRVGFES